MIVGFIKHLSKVSSFVSIGYSRDLQIPLVSGLGMVLAKVKVNQD